MRISDLPTPPGLNLDKVQDLTPTNLTFYNMGPKKFAQPINTYLAIYV